MIGMNTAITVTNTLSGIGFAIPSNTITKIVPILIENGCPVNFTNVRSLYYVHIQNSNS